MVKKIQTLGTILILFIVFAGAFTVLSTKVSFDLKMKGYSNRIIDWYTQNAEINLNWLNDYHGEYGKYDKKKNIYERIMAVIDGIEDNTEQYATGAFPKIGSIKQIADFYKCTLLHNEMEVVVGGKTNEEYAEEAVLEIKKFEKYLEGRNIDFLYVQLPGGTRITSYSTGTEYPSEELDRPDRFSKNMMSSGVPFLDINKCEDKLPEFSLDGSGHWMPEDALVTTKILAERLNNEYGYSFDLSLFNISEYYNAMDLAEDKNEVIQQEFGYKYELWVPAFNTKYAVDYCENEIYEGNFLETLLTPVDNWDRRCSDSNGNENVVIAYHDMWTIRNGAFVDIKNKGGTNNQGKKILVLGDSFSWPISSYLSVDVEELVALHPRYFGGDVKTYIDYYNPDMVIWIYQEGQCGSDNKLNFSSDN